MSDDNNNGKEKKSLNSGAMWKKRERKKESRVMLNFELGDLGGMWCRPLRWAMLEKERLVAGEDSKLNFGHHYVCRDVQCTVTEPNVKPRG